MPLWIDNWKTVIGLFTEKVDAVRPDQWASPTPCAEWDVTALVSHAVDYQRGYGVFLDAGPGIETELGADPAKAWTQIRPALVGAYDAPGALDRRFDFLAVFPGTVAEQVIVPTADLLIHTWDLARAIGADETLPADICEGVLAGMRLVEETIRIPELYGPALEAAPGADAQAQLLAFASRKV
jgi:uncharacterized protein (TIGR03086 family)